MCLLCFVSVCAHYACAQGPKNSNCSNTDNAAVFAGELAKATIDAMHPTIDHLTRRAQYELLIAAHPTNDLAAKAVPLLTLQTKCQQRDEATVAARAKSTATMLAALGQDIGHIIAITRLFKAQIKAQAAQDGNSGSAKYLKIEYDGDSETGLDNSKCTLLDYLTTETEATAGTQLINQKVQIHELKLNPTAAASGAATPMACGGTSGCTSAAAAGTRVGVGAGKLYAATAVTKPPQINQQGTGAPTVLYAASYQIPQRLAPVVDNLQATANTAAHAQKPCLPKDFKTDADFIAAAYYSLIATDSETKLPDNAAKQVEDRIKTIYGESDAEFEKKFWKEAKELKIPKLDGKPGDTVSLESITDINSLNKLIAYAKASGLRKEQEAEAQQQKDNEPGGKAKTDAADKTEEKKGGDNKTNTADCTGTEEGKCDKTKCEWNAEKKEGKIKEGAACYFLCDEAPLLLALLLNL
uniref:Variant surface glycoprotein 769 n=1 Tax=Trypanosoma brucei TaxID=5691 RepID=M4TAI6_9TRYP|nr:variant surface glycoprotein 769 [Trypanosoma brucei]